MLLNVRQLSGFYGEVQVLFDVSFTVEEGKIVSIVGSNAAGKTTIIKTICGMNPVSSGSIEFMGQDVTHLPASRLVELGIVQISEGRNLFPSMTVQENLEMGAFNKNARRHLKAGLERVYSLFPALLERRKQMAGTLSGGEQQMVAIGRGLMSRPKLMMFDEPSHGLAPIMVQRMFDIVQEINREGTTVLMVEQNVFHALSIAWKGYIIENGRVVLGGLGQELLKNDKVRQAYLGI